MAADGPGGADNEKGLLMAESHTTQMNGETKEGVLRFWFGEGSAQAVPDKERLRFWFNGGERVDGLIRERYAALVEQGGRGYLDAWLDTPRGTLAMIVLLDQFPRNIYRGSARAYAFDERALAACREGQAKGWDELLSPLERAFFYLPLEHAEDLAAQERSVALFARLLDQAETPLREVCAGFYDYAVRHRDVIARFGRFPHRNHVLGRDSTPEEIEFLQQPGSSF